jgi:hypothetical protein
MPLPMPKMRSRLGLKAPRLGRKAPRLGLLDDPMSHEGHRHARVRTRTSARHPSGADATLRVMIGDAAELTEAERAWLVKDEEHGIPIRVLPLERIVMSKRASGRPKDLEDDGDVVVVRILGKRMLPEPRSRRSPIRRATTKAN